MNTKKIIRTALLTMFFISASSLAYQQSWQQWMQQFKTIATSDGINPLFFDQIFTNLQPSSAHLHLDRTQPETRLTYYKYRDTRGDAYRIKIGRSKYKHYQQLLEKIGGEYGVNPCVITALWGLESSYGNFMGNFDVIRSLATLTYEGRRRSFFQKELLLALHMLQNEHINRAEFKGEWAGASGQSQFLPSSWYKYAVDYNGDGKKDIWHTHSDIFASIANYLHENGWQTNQPVLEEASLPKDFDKELLSLKITKPLSQWKNLGVYIPKHANNNHDPAVSLIQPYGGPVFVVFNNFRVLMRWNYSSYYAGTVDYVANKICQLDHKYIQ